MTTGEHTPWKHQTGSCRGREDLTGLAKHRSPYRAANSPTDDLSFIQLSTRPVDLHAHPAQLYSRYQLITEVRDVNGWNYMSETRGRRSGGAALSNCMFQTRFNKAHSRHQQSFHFKCTRRMAWWRTRKLTRPIAPEWVTQQNHRAPSRPHLHDATDFTWHKKRAEAEAVSHD